MGGATRTVAVALEAKVAGYIANIRTAGGATKAAFGAATSATEKQRHALGEVSTALGVIGVAAVAGVGLAVKTYADFEAKLSQVKSLSHATAAEMEGLKQAAMTAGVDIGFSASEAADAEIELVKAGVSVRDIMGGGLRGALTLAAAGQIDVAEATSIAAIAMTQFNVAGKDVPHVADLLAAGADKALGGVDDLGMALKQSGLVSSQFGLSLDDTVGTLSAFANAGLLGSDAGTSFKQMLLSLANPTGKAAGLMHELGIEAYDAQGNFIGIAALAGQLHDKLGGLSQAERNAALSTIFGSDAIRAANVLYTQGQKGIQGWIDAVDDQGFAAEQAAGKMDNLEGDVQKLHAAFENDLIKSASGGNAALRDLVQTATAVVKVVGEIPAPVLSVGLGLTALLGGSTLAAAGLLKVVQVGSQFKANMSEARTALAALAERMAASGPVGSKLAVGLRGVAGVLTGPWGLALAGGVVALGYFAAKHAEAKAQVEELTQAIREDSGALGQNARQAVANSLAQQGAYKIAHDLGVSVRDVTDATLGNAAAQARVNAALAKTATTVTTQVSTGYGTATVRTKQWSAEAQQLASIISGQNGHVNEAVQNARDLAKATGATSQEDQAAAKTAADLANSTGQVSDALNDAKDAAQQFKDALDALNSTAQTAEETDIAWQRQLKETRKELEHGSKSFRGNSKDVLDNREAMLRAVQAAQEHAAALADEAGGSAKAAAYLSKQREKLIDVAVQAGFSRKEAERYVDSLLKIPTNVDTDINNNATSAGKKIKGYKQLIYSIPNHVTTTVRVAIAGGPGRIAEIRSQLAAINAARNGATGGLFDGRRFHFAGGGEFSGLLSGPGSGTSDSIAAPFLSNGEYVMKHAAVQFWGKPFMDFVNAAGAGKFQGSVRGVGGGPGAGDGASLPPLDVRVFIGDRELTDIVDVRIRRSDRDKKQRTMARAGAVR